MIKVFLLKVILQWESLYEVTWVSCHKRGYHTHSDVVFGWVAWIWLSISDFFAEYLDFFSRWVVKLKKHTAAHRRARASLRPPLRPSGPAVCPRVIFQFYHTSWKQRQDTQQKSRDTQPNPRYSAKNNVGMRMIAPFMPKKLNQYIFQRPSLIRGFSKKSYYKIILLS